MGRVLIVDDDANIRTHLTTYLREVGHEVDAAADAAAALAALARGSVDAVLSDVRMAGMDGFALLGELRRHHPETGIVLMTAYASVPDAVEAIRSGAYDYLVKPFSLAQVGAVLDRLLALQRWREENRTLPHPVEAPPLLESRNGAMQRVLATARRAAVTEATVLLTGESGVGKNALAIAMHRWSPRERHPFVAIACTTLVDHLLESELFGHVRGAFAGAWCDERGRLEAADGGTAYLDEVGDLSAALQAKLLRFLEERCFERVGGTDAIRVTTRIVAGTSRDLASEVRAGRFREDLFDRLNVIALRLPPLRERREDLTALTHHVLRILAARHRRSEIRLTGPACQALETHPWPGNVGELFDVLERAVVRARGNTIDAADLRDQLLVPHGGTTAPQVAAIEGSLADVERHYVERVLGESASLDDAAARLGINPTTLWRKRKRWGLG